MVEQTIRSQQCVTALKCKKLKGNGKLPGLVINLNANKGAGIKPGKVRFAHKFIKIR
jgi:hypothetical protein